MGRALLLTGTVGAGKTSVAEAVGDLLAEAEVPHAVIDLDWLRRSWPAPPGDRFNVAMELRNLRSVAHNYLEAGADRLVLAGVVETGEQVRQCHDAVGVDLTVCRLKVELGVVQRRLARRHMGDHEALRRHLDRSGELDRILDDAKVADVTVTTTSGTLREVAADVLGAVGWE
ncbi:adenylyl-sulfate kinase [Streptacidiphilus sp. N1-12]|uniref:Adenylyl-sulfate kinase n=2 Tax=Streptacidiphilus alkalitolerans TaxID=3342712 RepID=A0ABV6V2W1_9ACTN